MLVELIQQYKLFITFLFIIKSCSKYIKHTVNIREISEMAGAFSQSFLHVDTDCVHSIAQTWQNECDLLILEFSVFITTCCDQH